MRKWNHVWLGLLAGLIGATAGMFILWGSWLLPVMGLVLTRVSIVNGMAVMLIAGVVGGGIYALILGRRRLRLAMTVLTGLILGSVLWVAAALLLVPIILGFPPQLANAIDHWLPLLAFSVYGLITALLYSRWAANQSVLRLNYAMGLVLLAAVSVPLLLRAAVSTDPSALSLPAGYRAQVVARGFTYPTSIAVSDDGRIYVAEAGFSYGPKTTVARILEISPRGQTTEIARDFEGPLNGLTVRDEMLYVSHRGRITRLDPATGQRTDLVRGLPSLGDHQNNDLVFGPDGALYFGQGTATNAGVVGSDNFVYAWADRYPRFHDVPSRDFVMTGANYETLNLGTPEPADTRITGPFAPFGQARAQNEVVRGSIPASGAIHRLDVDSKSLSIYADGLRNPYGLTWSADGELFATNLGYDDRGVRAVSGSPDWIVRVKEGAWYGWPDFAGTVPLTDERFESERGLDRRPLIKSPPPVEPPLHSLPPHYSPMKLAFSPEQFGRTGLFIAVYGDAQPLTEDLSTRVPTGVLVIDQEEGTREWFVTNRNAPRAGRTGDGLKRVIDIKFSADGREMYVLDFGVLEFTDLAPNAIPNTGVLWKITRR